MLADLAQKSRTSALWADVLSAARDEPGVLDEVRATPELLAAISLDEVKAAAAKWLRPLPIEMTALPRRPAH